MMKLPQIFFIIFLLCGAVNTRAQMPEESSSMPAQQWTSTLDGIKSQAHYLVIQNNGLQTEYQRLMQQAANLQQAINDQQDKNEQMANFLKERNGKTDQQVRIEELTQMIKNKKMQALSNQESLENLDRKQVNLEHSIQKMQQTLDKTEELMQASKVQAPVVKAAINPQADEQLIQLRKQLDEETRQEVLLENELKSLKTTGSGKIVKVADVEAENKKLEAHLYAMQLQEERNRKARSDARLSQVSALMYNRLKKHKEELESKIYAYEMQMEEFKKLSLSGLSGKVKKNLLVHQVVQMDASNNKMREKIKVYQEDIDVLKDQVARLERRVDFAQGKNLN